MLEGMFEGRPMSNRCHQPIPPVPRRGGASPGRVAARLSAGVAALAAAAGLAGLAGLGGCATPPEPRPVATTDDLRDDAAFAPASVPVDASSVFALTDAMRAYVAHDMPRTTSGGMLGRDKLLDDLYTKGRLKLDYESSGTLTAAQAFEARRGNCLSLVILTAAFAKEMNLDVTFQSVDTDEVWSRAGDLYFLSGHVNVVLGLRASQVSTRLDYETQKVVDFLPIEDQGGRHTHPISEQRVLAMYMNNRAAESLGDDQVDNAYWFAQESIRLDPTFLSAYNTLGVVYLRHHDPARAEHVLRLVAVLAPNNPRMLGNLAQSVRDQGRIDEAKVMEARLEQIEPIPPFHWFVLGQLAMARGDYAEARKQFQRELAREPDYHEFHFWLALADLRLGYVAEARQHLAIALENSTRRTDHDLYAAKLDRLTAAGVH
jgi:Tfp pilus assembly protein PilF